MPDERIDVELSPRAPTPNSELLELGLEKAALLLRRHTIRWRHAQGAYKPEEFWGLLQIPDEEIDNILTSPALHRDSDHLGLKKSLSATEKALDQVNAKLKAAEHATFDLSEPFVTLSNRFDLSDLDQLIICLLYLPEFDPRYQRLIGFVRDDATRTHLTFEMLRDLLAADGVREEGLRSRLNDEKPLAKYGLIATSILGLDPISSRTELQLSERIGAFLGGQTNPLVFEGQMPGRGQSQANFQSLLVAPELLSALKRLAPTLASGQRHQNAVVFLLGDYGSQKRAVLSACATAVEKKPIIISSSELINRPDLAGVLQRAFREASLTNAIIAFHHAECFLEDDPLVAPARAMILDWVESAATPVWFLSEQPWNPQDRFRHKPFIRLDIHPASVELRRHLWLRELEGLLGKTKKKAEKVEMADLLAKSFQLESGRIKDAITLAKSDAIAANPEKLTLTLEHLYEGCRRQSGERLGALAKRIEPTGELDFSSLILAGGAQSQINELRRRIRLCHHVYSDMGFRERLMLGRGTIALFTGGPGTGKTMAAQLLAKEQSVDLYQVDLSSVVSKYVGDTEKNLSRIFDEARDTNAILFFDEADSLFGKRGEVKDARDRWANMEINYLLQRVEEFEGTIVLSTNLRQNIDAAFLRRIHVIVNFPFPDAEARLKIWQSMFPKDLPMPELAFLEDVAARFPLAGGNIRNVMVDAAFRALDTETADISKTEIKPEHILVALGREYLKMDKPITATEFGEEFYAILEKDMLI